MKIASAVVAVIAVLLLGAGLIVGFGVTVTDSAGYNCGSAMKESSDLYSDQLVDAMIGGTGESTCDSARNSAKPLPIVLLVLGGLAALGAAGLLVAATRTTGRSQASPA